MSAIESSSIGLLPQPQKTELLAGQAEGSSTPHQELLKKLGVNSTTSNQELSLIASNLITLIRNTTNKVDYSRWMQQLRAVTAEQQRRKEQVTPTLRPLQRLLQVISTHRGGQDRISLLDLSAVIQKKSIIQPGSGYLNGTDLTNPSSEVLDGIKLLAPVLYSADELESGQNVATTTAPIEQNKAVDNSKEPAATASPESAPTASRTNYAAEAQKQRDITQVQATLAAQEQAARQAREQAELETFIQTQADRILTEFRTKFPYRTVTGQELILVVLQDTELKNVDIIRKMKIVDRALKLWEDFSAKLQKVKPPVEQAPFVAPVTRPADEQRQPEVTARSGGMTRAREFLATVVARWQARRMNTELADIQTQPQTTTEVVTPQEVLSQPSQAVVDMQQIQPELPSAPIRTAADIEPLVPVPQMIEMQNNTKAAQAAAKQPEVAPAEPQQKKSFLNRLFGWN